MSEEPVPVALVLTPVASAAALAGLCSMTGLDVHVVPSRGGAVAVLELTSSGAALSAQGDAAVGAAPTPPGTDVPAGDGADLTTADGAAPAATPAAADAAAPGDDAATPTDASVLPGTADDAGTGIDWDISELLGPEVGDGVPPAADELARTLSRLSKSGVVLLTATLATDAGLEPGLSGQLSARRYSEGEPGEEVPPGLILAGADEVVEDLILGRCRVEDVRGHERSGTLPRWKAAQMFAKGLRRRRP
ncbi:hypothetical protein [Georgenia wangjunii]|uniref:hypothetical protein n=1 Tax=Georgenia wangjunii TaxID=3117730 RepID=UPI002F268DB9